MVYWCLEYKREVSAIRNFFLEVATEFLPCGQTLYHYAYVEPSHGERIVTGCRRSSVRGNECHILSLLQFKNNGFGGHRAIYCLIDAEEWWYVSFTFFSFKGFLVLVTFFRVLNNSFHFCAFVFTRRKNLSLYIPSIYDTILSWCYLWVLQNNKLVRHNNSKNKCQVLCHHYLALLSLHFVLDKRTRSFLIKRERL